MSTLISLSYQKLNNSSCLITALEESANNYPNSALEETAYKPDTMTTCLLFLCDLLEKNKISCELIKLLKTDLNLSPSDSLTEHYFNYDIVKKYVSDIEIVRYKPAGHYLRELPITDEAKDKLKDEIINANVPNSDNVYELDLYTLFEDEEGNPLFEFDVLRNLARLENYMSFEQIMEIRPGYIFKMILRDDYLDNIEIMNRIESSLDTWVCEWLEKM